ncbi:MAG: amidase, partial [Chloroflexi bacterium]|nr:amidase [Chloroflexota bacterium]
GPLHGIPVALKDLFATAGVRTTAGSQVLADWVPDEDAAAVTRLRSAGAVLLGKLTMHEFAFGVPALDDPFPPARNPWNRLHMPGGSSSGSGAALAAGLCQGSLGSDTGGSIRIPAAYCGVTGLKPSYVRVSRRGVVPLAWSLDHVGPMARSAEDCALLLQAIAGYDPNDPASSPAPVPDYRAALGGKLAGLRIGLPRRYFFAAEGAAPGVLALVEAALADLERAGARLIPVDIPHAEAARHANTVILTAEAYAYHEAALRERAQDFGDGVRTRFLQGGFLRAADYLQAQRTRSLVAHQVAEALGRCDLLATPTMPRTAPAFAMFSPESTFADPSYTSPFNLVGLPALSVPCGIAPDGLPVGLQLIGRNNDDAGVLQAGHAYQQITDWHLLRPPILAKAEEGGA